MCSTTTWTDFADVWFNENCCPAEFLQHCRPIKSPSYTYSREESKTRSWERTSGKAIETGVHFSAGIPDLLGIGGSSHLTVSESTSHSYGREETATESFAVTIPGSETAAGARKTCEATTRRFTVRVPWTAEWSDGSMTQGVFRGQQFTRAQMRCGSTFPAHLSPPDREGCVVVHQYTTSNPNQTQNATLNDSSAVHFQK